RSVMRSRSDRPARPAGFVICEWTISEPHTRLALPAAWLARHQALHPTRPAAALVVISSACSSVPATELHRSAAGFGAVAGDEVVQRAMSAWRVASLIGSDRIMPNKTSRPVFRTGPFYAVASIPGRYAPPGPKPGPPGLLGLYFAKAPKYPRYS